MINEWNKDGPTVNEERPDTPPQRSFLICKDHQHIDWNQPALDDEACILCRLFYLEAQESLLEEWQQRAKRAEDTITEIQRPLDAQMARLNATVARLNDENEKLRAMRSETALTDEKGRPMTYWGGAASPDKRHGAYSPLTEHEITVLREEMLSDDGFLPEGKERVARLCDMALASIAPSAELPPIPTKRTNEDRSDWYGSGYVDGWNACVDRMRNATDSRTVLK